MDQFDDLRALFHVGIEAVKGEQAVARVLASDAILPPDLILSVGKAAVAMARPAAENWPHARCLIVTKYGHAAGAPSHAQIIEAAHPVPDAQSVVAGQALWEAVAAAGPTQRLLMLVSGGASALAELPLEGQSLADIQNSTSDLLASGADIATLNAHRKSRSRIKGGKLLAAFPGAHVTTLAISDVEGDALATIGSGIGDAPANAAFSFVPHIIASNAVARAAVAEVSKPSVIENDECLYDDVAAVAPRLAERLRRGEKGLYIFGGEPVVTLPPNPGRGGRNMALALAMARELVGVPGIRVLVAGTDGTDGPTDAAGAIIDGQTWDDSGQAALDAANAYPWLDARGALLRTGPTGTNVMDLVIAQKV